MIYSEDQLLTELDLLRIKKRLDEIYAAELAGYEIDVELRNIEFRLEEGIKANKRAHLKLASTMK